MIFNMVFRGGASGAEPPIRIIQGPKTQIFKPDTLDVDLKNDELIVESGDDSLLVFPRDANGDVPPRRILKGPNTRIAAVYGMTVDPVRNLIAATSRTEEGGQNAADKILVFNRTDEGDVAPRGVIEGPHTGILRLRGLQVDPETGLLFASVSNNIRVYNPDEALPTQWDATRIGFIGVWNITDNGDVPPRAVIKGQVAGTVWPVGVAINPAAGEVYYIDMVRNGLFTFGLPELFKPRATSSLH